MSTFVLIMLFWAGDHAVALNSTEFNSQQTCEVAKVAADKEFNSSYRLFGQHQLYAVCAAK